MQGRSHERASALKIHHDVVSPYLRCNITHAPLPSIRELETVGTLREGGSDRYFQASRPPFYSAVAEAVYPYLNLLRDDSTIFGENPRRKKCHLAQRSFVPDTGHNHKRSVEI